MSRLVLDSINFTAVAKTRWPHLIGYVNGHVSAWTPEEINRTRRAGQLLGLVDVLGTDPNNASIIDWERGDVQSAAVLRAWVIARNQFRHDATVYCQPRSVPTIAAALRGEPCNLFVVELTPDGEPPFSVPHYPGQASNMRVIMRQFVFGPRSGGDYDMSICYADNFHPDQENPAHLFAARAAARAELGPYQNAATALEFRAESSSAAPADQAAAAVDQAAADVAGTALVASTAPDSVDPAAEHRAAEQAAAARQLGAAAAWPSSAAAAYTAAITAAITAPNTAGSGPGPAPVSLGLADVGAELGLGDPAAALASDAARFAASGSRWGSLPTPTAASSPDPGPDPADVDQAAEDGRAAAAGMSTAAAAAAQSPLNHDFIHRVLVDVGEVAKQLRSGGWVHAAHELERAGSIAWELGSALKSAGL
jgi:hypothetical protein